MANPASRVPVAPEQLALQRLYHWEKTAPGQVILTQPQGGGAIRDFTWGEAIGEVRRMAAHLRSLGFPPGSRIAILSKNCAHWLLADFAIWMAGHVSVPLYPTLAAGTIRQILEHSESKLLFVGKLDGWEAMRPGVPAGPALHRPAARAAERLSAVGRDRRRDAAARPIRRCATATSSRPSCTPRAPPACPRA